jgi:hypothetical protein
VTNAPAVTSGICGNRQTSQQIETGGGFNLYAEPVEIVSFQTECGETSFIVNRQADKKKKAR